MQKATLIILALAAAFAACGVSAQTISGAEMGVGISASPAVSAWAVSQASQSLGPIGGFARDAQGFSGFSGFSGFGDENAETLRAFDLDAAPAVQPAQGYGYQTYGY